MHASTRHGYPFHRQSHGPWTQNLKYEMITVIPCFVFVLPNSPTPTTYKLIYAELKEKRCVGKHRTLAICSTNELPQEMSMK
jgi:hypothetical protein